MIGTLSEKTNGGSLSTISAETLSKLVLNGDLSPLSQQQKLEYYAYRCHAAGLDPATKPFDLLKLQGKETLYATKECAAQISQRDKLSVTIVSAAVIGDVYQVQARVTDAHGRSTDDIGAIPVKGLSGDAMANAYMKATTKAKRRAVLAHSGLGMMDESELETVKGAQTVPLIVPDMDGASTQNSSHSQAPVAASPATQEPSKPKPAPVADSDTPSFASIAEATAQGYVPVVVKKVAKKTGEKNGKTWTRHGIEVIWEGAPEPIWLNTFSEGFAAYARRHEGVAAYVKWEEKQNGQYTNRDLTAVAEVSNG